MCPAGARLASKMLYRSAMLLHLRNILLAANPKGRFQTVSYSEALWTNKHFYRVQGPRVKQPL